MRKLKGSFVSRLILLALALIPFEAAADSSSDAVPNLITVAAAGSVNFTASGSVSFCSSWVNGSQYWGDIRVGQGGVTADGVKAMLSVLTAAKLAGRTIHVYATNGTASQYGCLVTQITMN